MTTDPTIDAARSALPLDLYRFVCEYLPHGPPLRPQVPHIVISESLAIWGPTPRLLSYRVRDAYGFVAPGERVLAHCAESKDYPEVWRLERRGRVVGMHIKHAGCCGFGHALPVHYSPHVGYN